jgi:hypothetical protein
MTVHRFADPTYDFGGGSFPGSLFGQAYDRINVVSGGIGAGGSAPAEPKKPVPHVNAGTYFVAFGEDGTSANTNRGFKALAENTDFLDDVVHRDLAAPGFQLYPSGMIRTSVVVPGSVYVLPPPVAIPQMTITQTTRDILASVFDANTGLPLHIDIGGGTFVAVKVTAITDALDVNVIGTGDGFYTNPKFHFTPSIPASVTFYVTFQGRANLVNSHTGIFPIALLGLRGNDELWAYAKTTREGVVEFNSDKAFNDAVTVGGTFTANNLALFAGPSVFGPASVTVNALATFNAATDFNAATTFNGLVDLSARATFTVNALATFTVNAPATFNADITASGDIFATTGDFFYFPARVFERTIPMAEGRPGIGGGWNLTIGVGSNVPVFWSCTGPAQTMMFPIRLPHGAVLTGVRLIVEAGAVPLTARAMQQVPDFGTSPADPVATDLVTNTIASTGGSEELDLVTSTPIVSTTEYMIKVISGQAGDMVWAIRLTWTDPGPINK